MLNWNNQSHHNKQLLLLFFLSMKTLCLSCFVGYCRCILYTFGISFHRFLSSLFALCVLIWCVFVHTKILNFMFQLFEKSIHLLNTEITWPWRRTRSLYQTQRSCYLESCWRSLCCAEWCGTPVLPIYSYFPWDAHAYKFLSATQPKKSNNSHMDISLWTITKHSLENSFS